ncbi:coagulase domain-containing protein [Staphylococcus aureus]|nr:coagulase domain-containing protein [Staphylococcus aureus]
MQKWFEKHKSENPHSSLKKIKFDDFDLYRLTKKEYNELHQSLKEAVDEFNSEVKIFNLNKRIYYLMMKQLKIE